jgi:uncharacterized RDD family membrane protein YckC
VAVAPEAVSTGSTDVAHAGWDERFGAWILDVIIVWGSLIALSVALRFAMGTADEEGTGPELLLVLAWFPLAPLYFAFFHAGARGQTLGKRVAHIAVKMKTVLGGCRLVALWAAHI